MNWWPVSTGRSVSHVVRSAAALAVALLAGGTTVSAQGFASAERGAAALGSAINSLGNTSRVLVIGAHPDDEDTQLIAWLARGRHVETAYLSLTRGDGGQNLIGNELGEALGVIRTEELLAARRIDGGRQFFTRAYDFGFSKNAEETMRHWPRDTVMGDVVRVVRAFRPQVIVAIFSGTPADGHGHHQVSGLLARDVYDLSADTVQYPTAVYGLPWTVSKFYRRIRTTDGVTTRMNVGEYDALLGRSYAEIAAESRSQHQSQGFGMLLQKGAILDQVGLEASRVSNVANAANEGSLFAGMDTTWARLRAISPWPAVRAALDSSAVAFAEARAVYRADNPTATIEPLARAVRLLRFARDSAGERPLRLILGGIATQPTLVDSRGVARLQVSPGAAAQLAPLADAELWNAIDLNERRAERALALAAGIAVEAFAPAQNIPMINATKPGVPDTLLVNIAVHNRGQVPVRFVGASVGSYRDNGRSTPLLPDSAARVTRTARARFFSTQWWRTTRKTSDVFAVEIDARDDAERAEALAVTAYVRVDIAGQQLELTTPVINRFADPVHGEQLVKVAGVPGVTIGLDRTLEYMRAGVRVTRQLNVKIQSVYTSPETVSVSLLLPNGLIPDSAMRVRVLTPESPTAVVTFQLSGQLKPDRYEVHAVATHRKIPTQAGYSVIQYDHIGVQRLQTFASMWLTAITGTVAARTRVAYIPGVGDIGYEVLRQLDVNAERIDPTAIETIDFSRYTAVVVGPRAYQANPLLVQQNAKLLEYTRKGGTLVVQYGQQEMMRPGMMPYPIQLARTAERVTIETAPVTVLSPGARLLNGPNKIGPADWDEWVQERALYMPTTFDQRYVPLLQMNDPGEPPNKSAILTAAYGRGQYVYVTLALFRQLHNGVPGAARIFLNLVSATPTAPPRM